MPQPSRITLTGAVAGSPMSCAGSLFESLNLTFAVTYASSKANSGSVNSTSLAPWTLPLESIAKVRFFAIKVAPGASLTLLLSSTNGGADQAVPCSGMLVLHVPNWGDEITAIKIVGVAEIEYLIAGDIV